jgi:predicted RNase H-like nuclease
LKTGATAKEAFIEHMGSGGRWLSQGWIATFARLGDVEPPRIRVVPRLTDVVDAPEAPTVVAIDMPIGLTERTEGPGRAPEQAVRPLLGGRQSSVFSMPSRAAVYAPDYPQSCAIARATSDPPRAVSIQGFHLFPKIREVDALLRGRPDLVERVYEVHPELAFWTMNGEAALGEPKKVKGMPYGPGLALRRDLLRRAGLSDDAVNAVPPRGAAADDLLDALAGLVVARKIAEGRGRPFPDPPGRDAHGLPVAIWTFRL